MDAAATHQTLVLSQGYEPTLVVSWQRAITLLFLGKAEIIESYDRNIKTTSLVIKIPAVVRLLNAFRRHKKPLKFSRINVYGRDEYRCQYCGLKKSFNELTYDHVIPRAQGGSTFWLNVVSACNSCNTYKGNRTPEQAGMKLLKKPVQPVRIHTMAIELSRRTIPDAWLSYIPDAEQA